MSSNAKIMIPVQETEADQSRPISTQVVHNRTSLKLTNQGFEPPQTPVCNETGNFGN